METPKWDFCPVSSDELEVIFADVLDRAPTAQERVFWTPWTNHAALLDNVALFSRPWRRGWPLAVLFAGCHGVHFVSYWRTRQDIPDVNIAVVFTHKLEQAGASEFLGIPLLQAMFKQARYFSAQPSSGGVYTSDNVVKLVPGRVGYYHNPTAGCFFPVCEHAGMKPVADLLRAGFTRPQILDAFNQGSFDPQFETRYAETMQILREKDKFCATPFADFVARYLRKRKMFSTWTHATPVAYVRIGADLLSYLFGLRKVSDGEVLAASYPVLVEWGEWPETHYEREYYKVEYPCAPQSYDPEYYRWCILNAEVRS